MKYIVNNSNDPAYNIALEAYAFKELTDIDEIFILWINEPAIIIGKHQNAIQEINKEYTDAHGIHVVRRLSGGGAVYHDLNNLNYTIISNKSEEGAFDFKTFSKPVIDTLATLGVEANFTGRNDLEIDGKKISDGTQMVSLIHNAPGKELTFKIKRNDSTFTRKITPNWNVQFLDIEWAYNANLKTYTVSNIPKNEK